MKKYLQKTQQNSKDAISDYYKLVVLDNYRYRANKPLRFFVFISFFLSIIQFGFGQAGTWNVTTKTGTWTGSLQVGPGSNENTRDITFAVTGLSTKARPVEVRLSLNHECIRDMDIYIISPTSYSRELTTDNPNKCDNRTWTNIGFRDDASTNATGMPNSNISNITYVPENWLNDFCENPNGTWTIRVQDDAGGDQGTLYMVTIIFQEPDGDEVTYKTGSDWNAYVYRGGNFNCYRGLYVKSSSGGYLNQNFSESWTNNQLPPGIPSGTGIVPFRHDVHSISYRKNINFSRMFYLMTVSHDDVLEVKANSNTIYNQGCCVSTGSPNRNTYLFDGSTDLELRFRETGGAASIGYEMCQMAGDYTYGVFPTWNAYTFNRTNLPSNNFYDLNQYAGWYTTNSATINQASTTLIHNNWGSSNPRGGTGPQATVGSCSNSPTTGNDNFSVRYLTKRTYSSAGIYVFKTQENFGSGYNNDDGRRLFFDNGITEFFAKRVRTDELCVGTICVTQDQFMQMVQQSGQAPVIVTSPQTEPDPQPTETNSDIVPSDESVVTPPDTSAPADEPVADTPETPIVEQSPVETPEPQVATE